MATRFNTFGTTSGIATETTQRQIKDKLNDTINVNVTSLPSTGGDVNITAVANQILGTAHVPVDIDRVDGNALVGGNIPVSLEAQNAFLVVDSNLEAINSNPVAATTTSGVMPVELKDTGTLDNNITEVNGNAITGSNLPMDIKAVNGNIIGGSSLPVSFFGVEDVNLNQVNGSTVNVQNGNALVGTQRVVVAEDQKTTSWEDVPIKNGASGNITTDLATVSGASTEVNNGLAGLGTQRVVLGNNQDTSSWGDVPIKNGVGGDISIDIAAQSLANVNMNVAQVNGQVVTASLGATGLGTQRVTLANDQNCESWASVPGLLKRNYEFVLHHVFQAAQSAATAGTGRFFMDNTGDALFSNITTGTLDANLIWPNPSVTAYVWSGSANDTAAGTGARTVLVSYLSSAAATSVSTIVVSMNGVASTPVGGIPNFYRLVGIRVLTTGSLLFNAGNIRVGNLGQTVWFPGFMPAQTSKYKTSHLVVPNGAGTSYLGTSKNNEIIFDYINWHVENSGGTSETIYIYGRDLTNASMQTNPWSLIMQLDINENLKTTYDLRNALLPASGYEFAYTFTKTSALGTMYWTVSVGFHRQ